MPIKERRSFLAFAGRREDGTTVQSIVPQFDGSSHAGENCGCASEAHRDLVHAQGKRPGTGDPWPPTGASIRRGTGDGNGGTTPRQTAAVSLREYKIPNDIRVVTFAEIDEWQWKGGSVTLLIRYAAISEAGYSGSPGFMGSHSIPLGAIRDLNPGEDLRGDIQHLSCDPLYDGRRAGIPKGPHWLPRSVLAEAAGDLDLGGTTLRAKYGPRHAMVSFGTRIWTPPPPATPIVIRPRATKLQKPRIYTPKFAGSWLRRTPFKNDKNRIGRVNPGFAFAAYQTIRNGDGVWVGNRDNTAWMLLAGLKFVRYI